MTECLHFHFHIKYQERITKEERGGDILKQTQNNVRNGGMNVHTDDYLKCKQVKHSNKKTQTCWMDTKRPVYTTAKRDTLQICMLTH